MLKSTIRFNPLVLCLAGSCLVASCTKASAPGAGGGGGRGGRGAGPAVPVVVGKVTQKDVPVTVDAIGNVEAFTTISVRSQVTGVLTEVLFKEGDYVNAGDHLFTIDPRPYQALLDQAEANMVRDQALLEQAKAQLNKDAANAEYAQAGAERQSQLQARGIISKDSSDQATAGADASAAAVSADKAAIASAQAQLVSQQGAVDSAKVALTYTVIRSPIKGRTGNLTIKPGNLVTANTSELMTIAQVQPVFVTFAVPSGHLPDIKRRLAQNKLPVIATPQDADAQPVSGMLSFYDNLVDTATDTIKLKATFDNDDRRLWPGEFARVSLQLDTLSNATIVSSEAVQTGQDGQFVFVVTGDQTVEQRPVTTGQRFNEDTVIAKGLNPGETVVTEGQLRLEPGTRITVADPKTGEAAPANQGGNRGGKGGQAGQGQGKQGGGKSQGGGGNGQGGGGRTNGQGGADGQNQNGGRGGNGGQKPGGN